MGWLYAELRAEHLGESSYSLSVAASLGLVSCHNGESTSGKPGMNEGGAPTKFPRPQPRGKIAGRLILQTTELHSRGHCFRYTYRSRFSRKTTLAIRQVARPVQPVPVNFQAISPSPIFVVLFGAAG